MESERTKAIEWQIQNLEDTMIKCILRIANNFGGEVHIQGDFIDYHSDLHLVVFSISSYKKSFDVALYKNEEELYKVIYLRILSAIICKIYCEKNPQKRLYKIYNEYCIPNNYDLAIIETEELMNEYINHQDNIISYFI